MRMYADVYLGRSNVVKEFLAAALNKIVSVV